MMRIWKVILSLILLCNLFGCAKEEVQSDEIDIMVCTDLHYLSKSLYDDGDIFHKLLESNDGKLIERNEEILEWLVKECIKKKPDVFCVTGDITFNGEVVSLLEVKEGLLKIKEAGIPVLVIPGNHDISYGYAHSYLGSMYEDVEEVNQEIFLNEMKEFGYDEAFSKDDRSFSYACAVDDKNWIIGLDANTEGNIGLILQSTINWLESVLKEAKDKGIRVTILSHQNILKQSELVYQGYVVDNHEEIEELLNDYGVSLVLSGHSHIQHIAKTNNLTDICNESVAIYPLSYGLVKLINNNEYEYTKVPFDKYSEEAMNRFDENTNRRIGESLDVLEVSEEIKEAMKSFIIEFNRASFIDDKEALKMLKNDERRGYWDTYANDGFRYYYMDLVFDGLE